MAMATSPGESSVGGERESRDLAELWQDLISGRAFLLESFCWDGRCFVTLESRVRHVATTAVFNTRISVLQRILLGESQKAVAIDHDLAVSTVALACSQMLRMMGKNHLTSRVPSLLIMAAHAACGLSLPPAEAYRTEAGVVASHTVISVERPDRVLPEGLTAAEQAVTRLLVEGHSHVRMAELRRTSPRTVANQLASVFRKLGVSGRAQLISKLIQKQEIVTNRRAALRTVPSGSMLTPALDT